MPVVLQNSELRAEVDPGLGAGLVELSWKAPDRGFIPLMRNTRSPRWFNDLASYLLIPWPNRIAGARLDWEGRGHALKADWPDGTAIHGLVKDKPWRIEQRSPVSALLTFSSADTPDLPFPWPFSATVLYLIEGSAFTVEIVLTHQERTSPGGTMPAGLGFHPFWRRTLWDDRDEVSVHAPGLSRYPCRDMIPTADAAEDAVTELLTAARPLGSLTLDDVFRGSLDNAEIRWNRSGVRLRYECSESLGHAVLYTGSPDARARMPDFFCLEPVTMVNEGFNLASRGWSGTGARGLAAGKSIRASWAVRVGLM